MNRRYRILLYLLIFIIQLVLDSYVNLGPYIYLCLMPLIILLFPAEISVNQRMLLSFAFGLLLDIFTDGVLGLNAAACVILAAVRNSLFFLIINSDRREKYFTPTPKNSGLIRYTIFLSFATFIYLFFYILFDSFTFRPIGFIALKLVICLVVNVVMMLLVNLSLLNKD